jgi:hypothetical protein
MAVALLAFALLGLTASISNLRADWSCLTKRLDEHDEALRVHNVALAGGKVQQLATPDGIQQVVRPQEKRKTYGKYGIGKMEKPQ